MPASRRDGLIDRNCPCADRQDSRGGARQRRDGGGVSGSRELDPASAQCERRRHCHQPPSVNSAHWMFNTLTTSSSVRGHRSQGGGHCDSDDDAEDVDDDEDDKDADDSDEDEFNVDKTEEDEYDQEMAACDEYELEKVQHPSQLLEGLNELRLDSSLCDVVLRSGDAKLPCHRCVLSSASPYFKAMFSQKMKEAADSEVTINGVERESLTALIDFIYSGSVTITQTNVQSLTSAANLLQILSVKNACSLFMEKHLDATNSLGVHRFAEAMDCPKLAHFSMQFCLRNFRDVIGHEEFLLLPCDQLIKLISADQLNVSREETVLSAVINWLQHQPDTRSHVISKVLGHVRLPLMSPYVLHDNVSVLKQLSGPDNTDWMNLVEEARLYNLLPDRRAGMQTSRTRPRRKSNLTKVVVCVGGEDDRVVLRSVEAFHPLSDSWTAHGNLPFAISKHALVVSGCNVLYLLGGEFPDSLSSRQVLKFDSSVGVWQEMASMSLCRSELGAAVLDGYIYVVGGWDRSSRLSSVERYHMESNQWEKVPPLPCGVSSASVVAHAGFLYVAGGAVDEKADGVSSLRRYDPRLESWCSELASMLAPRIGSAVAISAERIFIFGGWDAYMDSTNSVECYDIQADKWRECAPMKERRNRPGAALVGDCVYVMGGEKGWDLYHDSVECYSISENAWKDCGKMSTPRSWISCAALEVNESFFF